MAGWALGLSLALCVPFASLVAIGLAIAVLVKGRDGRDHGKGMAIAALVISTVVVIANVLVVIAAVVGELDMTPRDSEGRVTESGIVTVDRIRVGDCISKYQTMEEVEAGEWATGEVTLVPCDEPHRAEVFAINPIDPTEYVDQESLDHASSRDCLPGFEEHVGRPYRRSTFELIYYNPVLEGGGLLTDEVVCIVTDPDGLRENMIEGSRR